MPLEAAAMSLIMEKQFGSTPAQTVSYLSESVAELAEIAGHVADLAGLACHAAVIPASRHTEILADQRLAAALAATSDGFHYAATPARHAAHTLRACARHLDRAARTVSPDRFPHRPKSERNRPTNVCLHIVRRHDAALFQRRLTYAGAFNLAASELSRLTRCLDTAIRQLMTALSAVLDELSADPARQDCVEQLAEAFTTAAAARRALQHSQRALGETSGHLRTVIARLHRLRHAVTAPLYPAAR